MHSAQSSRQLRLCFGVVDSHPSGSAGSCAVSEAEEEAVPPGGLTTPATWPASEWTKRTRPGSSPALPTWEGVQAADVVGTTGCVERCPVLPGKSYQRWLLQNPRARPRDRRIVDKSDGQVQA